METDLFRLLSTSEPRPGSSNYNTQTRALRVQGTKQFLLIRGFTPFLSSHVV